ncbi:TetR family transcriptional regulator [bacterium]|nr:TetR family transcriptional regulator [bacterium]
MSSEPEHERPPDRRLARGLATREKVLDAAERLFSEHGFDGVSIRDIAAAAKVTLGVVGFHSGSKEDLFRTILARRVACLSAARRQRLDDLQSGSASPSVRDIMEAFIEPYVTFASSGDKQWRAYARLIANTASDDRWHPYIHELYDPVASEYLEAIRRIRPDADPERLTAAFVMSISAMLGVVASGVRIEALQGRAARSRTPRHYLEPIIDFCTAGVAHASRAPECSANRMKQKKPARDD